MFEGKPNIVPASSVQPSRLLDLGRGRVEDSNLHLLLTLCVHQMQTLSGELGNCSLKSRITFPSDLSEVFKLRGYFAGD